MSTAKKQISKKDNAKKKILSLVQTGHYKTGDRLPPETELVKILGCCRSTVREAVGLLVSEGHLTHVRGAGTYVTAGKRPRYTIAALFPDLCKDDVANYTVNIVPPMVSAIISEARQYNADIIVSGCGCDCVDIERENIKNAIDRGVDAVIICYVGEHHNIDALEELRDSGIPTVFVDRYAARLNPDYAVTDNFAGTYDAVNAMAELGIETIYFAANVDQVTSVRDRILGYTAAVNSLGLSCNVVYTRIELIVDQNDKSINRDSSEYRCLLKSLESMRLPAAVFSVNPVINAVVYAAIEDLKIPKDQLILGHFDSDAPTNLTDRCYFEVDQPFAELGAAALQIAISKIEGNSDLQQVALKPKLTIHNLSHFVMTGSDKTLVELLD